MLQIPFYLNEGRRCAQTSIRSVLSFKGIEKSLDEIDELMRVNPGTPITLVQIASAFDTLGIDFYYPVRAVFERLSWEELERFSKKVYPNELIDSFDFDAIQSSFLDIRNRNAYTVRMNRQSLQELQNLLRAGQIPICLINIEKMDGKEDRKKGHYLILTGIGKKYIYAHDSGPVTAEPNRKISKERFLNGWNLGIIDWDVIIV